MKKKHQLFLLLVVIFLVGVSLIIKTSFAREEEERQEESKGQRTEAAKTQYTESGNVDVGTKTLTLSLDISEFAASEGFSMDSFMGGMMPGMGMQQDNASSDARTLKVEEVYVESGQEIREGDSILRLTEESVNNIRIELAEDVDSAKTAYEQAVSVSRQSTQQAEADYTINTLYAEYSDFEYEQALKELDDTVEEKQEELEKLQKICEEAREELSEKQELLAEEKKVLENAVFTEEGTDQEENLYWWIVACNTRKEAQSMVDALEEEIDALQDDIEDYEAEIEDAQRELTLSEQAREEGMVEAQETKSLRGYQAENAQEIYDVAVGQSAFNEQQALSDYEEAAKKLEQFDQVIVDNVICAEEGGLITEVLVAAGDTLTQDDGLISLGSGEVTITLSVEEDDLSFTELGRSADIVISAFPDQVFSGRVTEIGDAQIDNNTNKTTYSVVVTVEDPGNLLYQDMTAEVTFYADQTEGDKRS